MKRLTELSTLPEGSLSTLLQTLEAEKTRRRTESRLSYYEPYPKQRDFHAAGATHRERLLMAGNQLGKTLAGGFEAAMHATGRYPDWWRGRRFDHTKHHRLRGPDLPDSCRSYPQPYGWYLGNNWVNDYGRDRQ